MEEGKKSTSGNRVEKRQKTKIVVLAILEIEFSPSTPLKKQLDVVARDVAAKLQTRFVKVIAT
ncbi:MAG: hypothetical protein ACFFCW_31075 [Candidatus Hodarchaeota archaeon]